MTAHIGLYYPFVGFNVEWLKLTALYWDRMARIVPPGFWPSDNESVRQLIDYGYVYDLKPSSQDLRLVGDAFVNTISEHGKTLRKLYGLTGRYMTERERYWRMAYPKIRRDLAWVLEEEGLAARDRDSFWVRLHPVLAGVYMTALAEAMANRGGLHPLTDSLLAHLGIGLLSARRLAAVLIGEADSADDEWQHPPINQAVADMALQCVLPANIGEVSTSRIIEFRDEFADERVRLQDFVEEMAEDLGEIRSVKDIELRRLHLEAEYERRILPELRRLERQLNSANIDTAWGAFDAQIALPPVVGAMLATTGIADPVVLSGGGLAIGIWGALRNRRKRITEIATASPLTYLYRVERELDSNALIGKLARRIKYIRRPRPRKRGFGRL